MSHRKQLTGRRVVHKSTGGILPSIPEPVDPVGNAAPLKSKTVALVGNHRPGGTPSRLERGCLQRTPARDLTSTSSLGLFWPPRKTLPRFGAQPVWWKQEGARHSVTY